MDPGERLGANHERALRLAVADEHVRRGHGIDETGADRLHVECSALRHADPVLDAHRRRRERPVRRRRRADKKVDVDGIDTGADQGRLGGADPEIGREFTVSGDVPGTDTRSFAYPIVGGIDDGGHLFVGQNALRQVGANASDD
jgi:hypothetical protein